LQGFKNGIAGVTGDDSKFYLCNANITVAEDVYYWNYYTLLNSEGWTTRDGTDEDAEDELDIELMTLVQTSM
jgi:hypothetical protein